MRLCESGLHKVERGEQVFVEISTSCEHILLSPNSGLKLGPPLTKDPVRNLTCDRTEYTYRTRQN